MTAASPQRGKAGKDMELSRPTPRLLGIDLVGDREVGRGELANNGAVGLDGHRKQIDHFTRTAAETH